MKKLLVLALLGLGLGAGVWKAQNPEGTIDTFRSQATSTVNRLKVGVDAVRAAKPNGILAAKPQSADTQALNDRLSNLEAQLQASLANTENQGIAAQPLGISATSVASDNSELGSRLANTEAAIASMGSQLSAAEAELASNYDQLQQNRQQQAKYQQTIDTLQSSLQSMQGSLDNTTNIENDARIDRLDAIDAQLELLVRRLEEQTYENDINALKDSIGSLDSELESVREGAVQINTSQIDDMTTATEQLAELGLRVDTLAAGIAASHAVAIDGSTDATPGSAAALGTLTTGLDERFKAIETRLQTVNTDSRRISSLNEQMETLRSDITELKQTTNDTSRTLNEVDESVKTLKTVGESQSIDTVQAEIKDQLSLVQSLLESNAPVDNSAALENLLSKTRGRTETLKQRIQALPTSSLEANNAQATQNALESQITSLEKRLENLKNQEPGTQSQQPETNSLGIQEGQSTKSKTSAVQYKIYFGRNSADITDDAATVLNSFITQEKNRTTGVSIFGFTDRRGSAIYNQQLALQRATNVRSYLIQNGLDESKINALTGLGEDAAAAILPDNADDAQQRAVVLYASQP